eukprot:scaffold23708_cov63-Phaeocystis_antarctica.AAC.1
MEMRAGTSSSLLDHAAAAKKTAFHFSALLALFGTFRSLIPLPPYSSPFFFSRVYDFTALLQLYSVLVEPSPTPSKHARTYYFTWRRRPSAQRRRSRAGDGELVTEIELPPSQWGALSDDAAAHLL